MNQRRSEYCTNLRLREMQSVSQLYPLRRAEVSLSCETFLEASKLLVAEDSPGLASSARFQRSLPSTTGEQAAETEPWTPWGSYPQMLVYSYVM